MGLARIISAPLLLLLAACTAQAQQTPHLPPAIYLPPPGSNQVFREQTHAAPGHELIVADLSLPPNAVGEAHWHPWEEYIYVIGGSAVLDIEGLAPRELAAGEGFVIPRRTVHTPRAGAQGIRAIVVRVHDQGDPVSVPASQALP